MLVKNTSPNTINLKTGSVAPGATGEADQMEFNLLMANNRIEIVTRKQRRPKAVDNG